MYEKQYRQYVFKLGVSTPGYNFDFKLTICKLRICSPSFHLQC